MEELTVNKSIFKINIYEITEALEFTLQDDIFYYSKYCLNKVKRRNLLETKNLCELNISLPILKVGEKFFIEGQNITVIIKEVVRTSEDNILYTVEEYIPYISCATKEETMAYVDENFVKAQDFVKLNEEYDKLKNKKWFEFWK